MPSRRERTSGMRSFAFRLTAASVHTARALKPWVLGSQTLRPGAAPETSAPTLNALFSHYDAHLWLAYVPRQTLRLSSTRDLCVSTDGLMLRWNSQASQRQQADVDGRLPSAVCSGARPGYRGDITACPAAMFARSSHRYFVTLPSSRPRDLALASRRTGCRGMSCVSARSVDYRPMATVFGTLKNKQTMSKQAVGC